MSADQDLPAAAHVGYRHLPGACWRPGDSLKHLGPPERLEIPFWSRLFSTRCGLTAKDGHWSAPGQGQDDDYWCPACVRQAGMSYVLVTDE